jgi:hypothetical protein
MCLACVGCARELTFPERVACVSRCSRRRACVASASRGRRFSIDMTARRAASVVQRKACVSSNVALPPEKSRPRLPLIVPRSLAGTTWLRASLRQKGHNRGKVRRIVASSFYQGGRPTIRNRSRGCSMNNMPMYADSARTSVGSERHSASRVALVAEAPARAQECSPNPRRGSSADRARRSPSCCPLYALKSSVGSAICTCPSTRAGLQATHGPTQPRNANKGFAALFENQPCERLRETNALRDDVHRRRDVNDSPSSQLSRTYGI